MDLGQVFTEKTVSKFMVSLLDIDKEAKILEPCFGKGVFIEECLNQGFNNIFGYELDDKLYKKVKKKHNKLALYLGDFLSSNSSDLYDAIIMNPPYIRHEKIDELKPLGISKRDIRKDMILDRLSSKANMYMYFTIKALMSLKKGGELVVIFPSSWLNTKSGKEFENLIEELGSIEKQIHISGKIFERNALVEVVILKLIRGKKNTKKTVEFAKLINDEIKIEKIYKNEKLILDKKFDEYASIKRGLSTGCNSLFTNPNGLTDKDGLVPILSSPKNIKGYGTKGSSVDSLLLVDGEKISNRVKNYLIKWERKIKKTKKPATLYKKLIDNKKWYLIKPINSKGILFSYFVRDDMKFIMNHSGILARDNFYIIYPSINKYILFAFLNNYYTYYQLEFYGKKYGAGLLKIQRYDVEQLTFPNIDDVSKKDFDNLIKLSKDMINHGNDNTEEITKILSNYTSWSFNKVKDKYQDIKANRLGVL